jgi:uncharacterized protein YukE
VAWHFSVALPADPGPCHDAADSLRAVARTAGHAADFLDGQSAMPAEDFTGAAARSYRAAASVLGADARGVADDVHALAAALDDYAVRIEGVRQELGRIREAALDAGLEITSDERVLLTPAPETPVDAAYERLEARATRAHAEAHSASGSWWRAVQRFTTGPLGPTTPLDDPPVRAGIPIDDRPLPRPDHRPGTPPAPPPSPSPSREPGQTEVPQSEPAADRGDGPRHHDRDRHPMVAATMAPLPPPLLLRLPAAHAPCPDGFEGVLT